MRKTVLLTLAMLVMLSTSAAEKGIKFFKGDFKQAVELAKQEKKMIFIDFYTDWCGPCMIMSKTIFVLEDVGDVYNKNFICMKIDAEKGEGLALSKKYRVQSFPTYVFIDPNTTDVVHRSGGNKPKEDFIADAKGALDPNKRSVYLEDKYKSGNYDNDFLISFIRFKKTSGGRGEAEKLFGELIARGAKLGDKPVWDIYVESINGHDNPYFKEVVANYPKYVELFGKKAVDDKLQTSTLYAPLAIFATLPDFEGKEQNMALINFSTLCRAKKYTEAGEAYDKLIVNPNFNQQQIRNFISFYARISSRTTDDSVPFEWLVKQAEMLRYIAYNNSDRDNAQPHYEYASGLEFLIGRAIKEGKQLPASMVATPKVGKSEYNMRPDDLKQKPKR